MTATKVACTTLMLLLTAASAQAFDLPRVIGEFRYDYPPADFTSIGDQNGDGKDDLLISSSNFGGGRNRFEVYLGSNEMGDRPAYTIPAFRENEEIGYVWYLGHLIPGNSICFATKSTLRNQNENVILTDFHSGFETGEDTLFDSWTTALRNNARLWHDGKYLRPFDFNGDGFNDICLSREISAGQGAMDVYFGGERFDSIPDWTKIYSFAVRQDIWSHHSSSGYDVNGDGYQDLLIRGRGVQGDVNQQWFYELFLGGANPDTMPVFRLWDESIQRRDNGDFVNMNYGFTMLPDVNADGYDDFAIYFSEWIQQQNASVDGVFIFFGGEEIDAQPDMALEGSHAVGDPEEGWITTGDFNGDGIGDVVVSYWQRPPLDNGEVNYHFGGAEFDTIPDVVVNHRDYNRIYPHLGQEIGGVGDYNGDGADDVVARVLGDDERNVDLVILAGSRAWDLSVPSITPPLAVTATISAYPNPFNSIITVKLAISTKGRYKTEVFDISGRKVSVLSEGNLDIGNYSFEWSAPAAGIYLVTLSTDNKRLQTIKILAMP